MARALAATAAALAVFTILVLAGATTGIDDWAIDHVMPALDPRSHAGIVTISGLWRPFPLDAVWWEKLLDAYLYPASFLVSAVVVALSSALLSAARDTRARARVAARLAGRERRRARRQGRARAAGRALVERCAGRFTSSPSTTPTRVGTARAGSSLQRSSPDVFPRVRVPAAVWVLFVPAALVVAADHTVSDVVGGTLLGLLLVLAVHAMMRGCTRWQTSSPSSSAGSSATPRPCSRTSPAARSSRPPELSSARRRAHAAARHRWRPAPGARCRRPGGQVARRRPLERGAARPPDGRARRARPCVRGSLPRVRADACSRSPRDPDLAWRLYALSLLAEELGDES